MTADSLVPPEILANVRQRWPDVADAWAGRVEAEFHTLCGYYRVTDHTVLPARYGFVVAVDTPDGPLVLRGSPDPHGPDQAAVAVALAKLGIAPTVHETLNTGHGTWIVLDRVEPGTGLYEADPTTLSLEALFGPLAAMRDQPAPRAGMPSIPEWLRERLKDDQLADLRPGTTVAPAAERKIALDLLAELGRDYQPGLCHGDASLGNIIASGADRWMYIDPRGMSGESAYDVAVLAIRVSRFLAPTDVVPQVASMAGVSPDRVRIWALIASAARV